MKENIEITYTNGKWLSADKMIYDGQSGDIEFEGNLRAGGIRNSRKTRGGEL